MTDQEKIKELRNALSAAVEWIEAVPSDVARKLPAMPGFDHDWVVGLLDETESAGNRLKQFDPIANAMLDLARGHAHDGIIGSRWYMTAPKQYKVGKPPISLTGIEYHAVATSMGGMATGSYDAPFLCGQTEVGGIKANFRLRLDFAQGGFVINEL